MAKAFNEEISYRTLFPDTDFNNLTEAYSTYGAGAFFVELMKIITDTNKISIPTDVTGLSLKDRRPDLWELEISQANADNEVPYLEIVNRLLLSHFENKVTNNDDKTLLKHVIRKNLKLHSLTFEEAKPLFMALGVNSFLPYNIKVAEVQTYLQTYGISLSKIAPYFANTEDAWVLTQTGLAKTDLIVLENENSANAFYDIIINKQGDITIDQFKFITQLDDPALKRLLYNNIPLDKRDTELKVLYINYSSESLSLIHPITDDNGKINNLDKYKFKRVQNFLILSDRLSWDFETLNAVLHIVENAITIDDFDFFYSPKMSLQIEFLAQIKYLADTWKVNPIEFVRIIKTAFLNLLIYKHPQKSNGISHQLLNSLNPFAKFLEIDSKTLLLFLPPLFKTITITYDNSHELVILVYKLQKKKEDLDKLGLKLQDYLSLLMLADTEVLDKKKFDKWYSTTSSHLQNTTDSYMKNAECNKDNDPNIEKLHLRKLLFTQWIHEFCVFTGLKELEVDHFFCGVFQGPVINGIIDYSEFNQFFFPQEFDLKDAEENLVSIKAKLAYAELDLENIEKRLAQDPTEEGSSPSLERVKKLIDKLTKELNEAKSKFDKLKITLDNKEDHTNRVFKFINRFIPHVLFLQQLNLDGDAVCFLGNQNIKTEENITVLDDELANTYIQFTYLYRQIKDEKLKTTFLSLLKGESSLKDFAPVMGWPQKDLNDLLKLLKLDTNKSKIESLYQLSHCFSYAELSTLDVVSLYNYVSIATKEEWDQATVPPAIECGHSKYKEYRHYYGKQLEKERDYLVRILLSELSKEHEDINSPDHLSDYLLCDVEMSGEMNITPLREATDAVQTYLMRCKNGLEIVDQNKLLTITKEEWQWIPNFRIWQAEQILRAYPENYLQAETRSTASKLFKDTINDLQGTELTNDKAETALLNYLDEWVDLVNAEIVDASAYQTYSTYFEKEVETLFLISKSRVKENTFYFNYKDTDLQNDQSHWAEWEEIPVKINSKTVSSVYAFNRLHLFWTEHSSVTDSVNNEKFTIYSLTIKCIYHNIDGSWSTPQTITSFPFYASNWVSLYPKESQESILELVNKFKPENEYWHKVGIHVVKDVSTKKSYIQLFVGPWWIFNSPHDTEMGNLKFDPTLESPNAAIKAFGNYINTHFNGSGQTLPTGTATFLLTPIFLNHALTPVAVPFKGIKGETTLLDWINCLNFYFDEPSGKIYRSDYLSFLIYNYQGTLGKTDFCRRTNGGAFVYEKDMQYPLLDPAQSLPITNYFAIRNKIGVFYVEFNHTKGYLFSIDIKRKFGIDGTKQLELLDAIKIDKEWISFDPDLNGYQNKELYVYNVDRIFYSSLNQLRSDVQEKGFYCLQDRDTSPRPSSIEMQTKSLSFDNEEHFVKNDDIVLLNPSAYKSDNTTKFEFAYYLNFEELQNGVDFAGVFGLYAQELFFHLPMAIASLMAKNLQYDDARTWYHWVYDSLGLNLSPNVKEEGKSQEEIKAENEIKIQTLSKVWKYYPFKNNVEGTSSSSFDPDIIAENNLQIYKHWTILQYIDFILDFADHEFRQETWESLSTAIQLYFEAEDLLGQQPKIKDELSEFEKSIDKRKFSEPITETFFKIPTNAKLKAHWDKVKDRLYKIRNGLNINGERQSPSMYGTAIDPARILLAKQNGGINPYDSSSLQVDKTVYRFRELAPHTESMINLVVEFGAQLYNALLQKDNEQLQVLQATHQLNLLKAVEQTYQYQIDEANQELQSLQSNLDSATHQYGYYEGLIEKGLLPAESGSIASSVLAGELQGAGSAIRLYATAAHLIPTVFGFSDGDFQPGSAIDSGATASNELGQVAQTLSQVLAAQAEHLRRSSEWQFQADQAQYSMKQIVLSMESAEIRLKIATENMKQYQLQVSRANEVYKYLQNKFTNAELYHWMSGQMSSLYFTSYQLALGALHRLQKAYAYELDETVNFIPGNSWNSLKKGLLAGETLKLALARMQDSYLNKNVRRQEIEKIISVKQHFQLESTEMINGKEFSITKETIGLTGSGSEIVKIKSISVSIPAVLGPYETFGATLKCREESITISRGIDDMGVFPEDMYDGRYLPFEGLKIDDEGLNFTFTVDKIIADKISDVILAIKFTAK
jgi:hypothetical protein